MEHLEVLQDSVRERLVRDIEHLTSWPDRVVGSEGHLAAREWARQRLDALGLVPYAGPDFTLPYLGDGRQSFANVVGVVPGAPGGNETHRPSESVAGPVVLGAHYDTVPGTPGADDNAASLAIVVEVARRLREQPVERPVVIAVFDAEEPPYFHSRAMGSTRFVNDHGGEDTHAAIILDLVAHRVPLPGLEDLVALMGAESHPALADVVRAAANGAPPVITVPNLHMPNMSDHHAFRLARVPYLFVTCGQGPHYHAPSDTLANIDLDKTVKVADLVERLVRSAAESDLDGARHHDSSRLDHEMLSRTVGSQLMARLGIDSEADTQSGIARLVALLQERRF